jgi:hypothetical protein
VVGGQLEEPADRRAALVAAGRSSGGSAGRSRGRRPPVRSRSSARMRAMRTSRSAVGAMKRLEAQVGVRPAPREVAPPARRRRRPRRRSAGAPRRRRGRGRRRSRSARVGRAASRRSRAARTSRVSCLASSTLGWSNGSMPRTSPAMAWRPPSGRTPAAEVDRVGRSIRMTGARPPRGPRRAAAPPASARRRSASRTNARSGPYDVDRAERLEVDGTMPDAVLAGALGESCSAHAPNAAISSSAGTSACRGRLGQGRRSRGRATRRVGCGSGSRQAPACADADGSKRVRSTR